MTTANKIQEVKVFLGYAFSAGWNNNSSKGMADDAETIIGKVARREGAGFAGDIANSVEKYKKISEKQAYWIAKFVVENNLTDRIEYLFEA